MGSKNEDMKNALSYAKNIQEFVIRVINESMQKDKE